MTEEESICYFKKSVKEYLQLDDEIKILDKSSKLRKEKKKNIGDTILSFIQQKDISHVKLQGNYKGKQIESQNLVRKSAVSFKSITNVIFDYFDDVADAKKLMDKINNNRVETQVSKLKIASGKKVKSSSLNLQNIVNTNSNDSLVEQVPDHMSYLFTTTLQNDN